MPDVEAPDITRNTVTVAEWQSTRLVDGGMLGRFRLRPVTARMGIIMSISPRGAAVQQVNSRRLSAEGYASTADAKAAVSDEERRSRERKDRDILRRLAAFLGEKPGDLQRALLSALTDSMTDIAIAVTRESRK
jgi:hypothetical protein